MAKQQEMWRRTFSRVAGEGEGSQSGSERAHCIGQTIIESLVSRYEELDTADCDVKVLLSIAAELRQWLHGQRGLDIREAAIAPEREAEDPLNALREFKENLNAVRKSPTLG